MSIHKFVEAEFPKTLPCKIAIVAEAPGGEEIVEGRPLVGSSGRLLNSLLARAGVDRSLCLVTNVFRSRPQGNDLGNFFSKKDPSKYHMPRLGFLKKEFLDEIPRLFDELDRAKPNVILALGGTALWALTDQDKITAYRGAVIPSKNGIKVLPSFHPAAVLREYHNKPFLYADIRKAKRESEFPEIHYPKRRIFLIEKFEELEKIKSAILETGIFSYDVEVDYNQVECISLAPSPDLAFVIPIHDFRKNDCSYWPEDIEIEIWLFLYELFSNPRLTKVAQNSVFDRTLLSEHGIPVASPAEDTMLMHHAYQLELKKDLGTLGSLYCNERSWKNLRVKSKKDLVKGEE